MAVPTEHIEARPVKIGPSGQDYVPPKPYRRDSKERTAISPPVSALVCRTDETVLMEDPSPPPKDVKAPPAKNPPFLREEAVERALAQLAIRLTATRLEHAEYRVALVRRLGNLLGGYLEEELKAVADYVEGFNG